MQELSDLRNFTGILQVDKPTGVTSHDVVAWARRATGQQRVGHAGTLDPLATGLLVVLVGREFTKRQAEFLQQDKEYLCTVQLGVTTDTYDSDGQVVQRALPELLTALTQGAVQAALPRFRGVLEQQVPAFSAVKQQGKKLYELARKGQSGQIALPIKQVEILDFELIEFWSQQAHERIRQGDSFDITLFRSFARFRIRCSSGTYIRSLIHDLGNDLGVGATVTQLRRVEIGSMRIQDAQLCPVLSKRNW